MLHKVILSSRHRLVLINVLPVADTNLNLARKHYRLRFEELRELILAEESKFKCVPLIFPRSEPSRETSRTVLKEIEEIRAGLWDTKIHAGTTDESSMEKVCPQYSCIHPPYLMCVGFCDCESF